MNTKTCEAALSTTGAVTDFAHMLALSAETLHSSLKRLTTRSDSDSGLGYSVLTEEYALRARANILFHDASRHVVTGACFSQEELTSAMKGVEQRLRDATSLPVLLRITTDLITFASAISAGNAKVMNFLAEELGIDSGRPAVRT